MSSEGTSASNLAAAISSGGVDLALDPERINDLHYRYKMSRIATKIEGSGNGIKTVFPNLERIATEINRPSSAIVRYIGHRLGAKAEEKDGKFLVMGEFTYDRVQPLVFNFIEAFVLCKHCRNPETTLSFGEKTNLARLTCAGCGRESDLAWDKITQVLRLALTKGDKDAQKDSKRGKKAKKRDEEEEEGKKAAARALEEEKKAARRAAERTYIDEMIGKVKITEPSSEVKVNVVREASKILNEGGEGDGVDGEMIGKNQTLSPPSSASASASASASPSLSKSGKKLIRSHKLSTFQNKLPVIYDLCLKEGIPECVFVCILFRSVLYDKNASQLSPEEQQRVIQNTPIIALLRSWSELFKHLLERIQGGGVHSKALKEATQGRFDGTSAALNNNNKPEGSDDRKGGEVNNGGEGNNAVNCGGNIKRGGNDGNDGNNSSNSLNGAATSPTASPEGAFVPNGTTVNNNGSVNGSVNNSGSINSSINSSTSANGTGGGSSNNLKPASAYVPSPPFRLFMGEIFNFCLKNNIDFRIPMILKMFFESEVLQAEDIIYAIENPLALVKPDFKEKWEKKSKALLGPAFVALKNWLSA